MESLKLKEFIKVLVVAFLKVNPGKRYKASTLVLAAVAGLLLYGTYEQDPKRDLTGDELCVMSWNMEWFPAGQPEPLDAMTEERNIARAAKEIKREGVPDVMFVQEIRDAATCSNLVAKLNAPNLLPAVCSDFWYNPTNRGLQQIAIFSRYPVVDSGYEQWEARDFVYPPRGYSWAVLDVNGKNIACFGVHLKSNYIPEGKDVAQQTKLNTLKRELAIEQLTRRIAKLQRNGVNGEAIDAVVVAGDFNTTPADERYKDELTCQYLLDSGFKDGFEGVLFEERVTLPANEAYGYPAVDFDRLYYRGLPAPQVRFVGRKTRTSDHLPLRVYFPKQ